MAVATGARTLVLVCRGPECGERRGSVTVHGALARALQARALPPASVRLDWQSCFGQCRKGVNVMVRPMRAGEDWSFVAFRPGGPGTMLYHAVVPEDADNLVEQHVLGGCIVEEMRRRNRG